MLDIKYLHKELSAVCPIVGVSVADPHDKTTWRIDFSPEATPEQRAAAQAVITSYDPLATPCTQFYARDLLTLLTDDDQAAIDASLTTNVTMRRIWYALLAQGDQPISVTSNRFLVGWADLMAALGKARVDQIAAARGIART